ncbi:hypothetical protein AAVH_24490, partial [Aphelenchoides avenae]
FTRVLGSSVDAVKGERHVVHYPLGDRKRVVDSFRFLHRCYVEHLRIGGKLVDPRMLVSLRNQLERGTVDVRRLSISPLNQEYECLAETVLMQFDCVCELVTEDSM